MKLSKLKLSALAFGFAAFVQATPLTPIAQGNTTAIVNGLGNTPAANEGQLYSIDAFGYEVYNTGVQVHDNGFQLGGDTNTFTTNNLGFMQNASGQSVNGAPNAPVSSGGTGPISLSGLFTGIGNSVNVSWSRTYTFVAPNVLREVLTVVNNGSAISSLQGFGSFNPGQSSGAGTDTTSINTTGTISGFQYAQAQFTGLNAVLATNSANVSIGFNQSFFNSGACVNALTGIGNAAGCDTSLVQGSESDRAYTYAFNVPLAASGLQGSSFEAIVYHIFGNSSFDLSGTLGSLSGSSSSSSSGGNGVPEPGSVFLMGSACIALGVIARRRAKR